MLPKTLPIALLLLAYTHGTQAQTPVQIHGRLKVSGTQLVDKNNTPVVLRGMSFGWHNFHPRFYNAGAVHWLSTDWKCSIVRAAMGVETKGGYLDDSAFAIAKIRTVVEAAIKEGIYVIIDWHSHHINLEQAKGFFALMAKDYGRYPNIIYEVFNEPATATWPEVKDYATQVIAVIRKSDPAGVILVGSPHWDQDVNLPADDPITGYTNLMYTLHYYAATHKQWLRDRADTALRKGLPIFISESAGMAASGDGPLDNEDWQAWITWSEERHLSWITWSVSDKDESCSVLQKSAGSEGGWKEADLKESGIKIRAYLREYNK